MPQPPSRHDYAKKYQSVQVGIFSKDHGSDQMSPEKLEPRHAHLNTQPYTVHIVTQHTHTMHSPILPVTHPHHALVHALVLTIFSTHLHQSPTRTLKPTRQTHPCTCPPSLSEHPTRVPTPHYRPTHPPHVPVHVINPNTYSCTHPYACPYYCPERPIHVVTYPCTHPPTHPPTCSPTHPHPQPCTRS